ncbi:hypothetical protein BX666DRAFT_994370 [Dichotomocladium elegans]|nr:hypothetical protein BX666DRAFT_994370 [Dichotomocladium elegans]
MFKSQRESWMMDEEKERKRRKVRASEGVKKKRERGRNDKNRLSGEWTSLSCRVICIYPTPFRLSLSLLLLIAIIIPLVTTLILISSVGRQLPYGHIPFLCLLFGGQQPILYWPLSMAQHSQENEMGNQERKAQSSYIFVSNITIKKTSLHLDCRTEGFPFPQTIFFPCSLPRTVPPSTV